MWKRSRCFFFLYWSSFMGLFLERMWKGDQFSLKCCRSLKSRWCHRLTAEASPVWLQQELSSPDASSGLHSHSSPPGRRRHKILCCSFLWNQPWSKRTLQSFYNRPRSGQIGPWMAHRWEGGLICLWPSGCWECCPSDNVLSTNDTWKQPWRQSERKIWIWTQRGERSSH